MSLILEGDARGSLGPYQDGVRACVLDAWAHWQARLSDFPLCSRRGRRVVVHEFILQEVRERFGDTAGVKITETRTGRFLVSVEGVTLLFKHVDGAFKPSNFPTPGSIRFNKQLPLPGVPKGPRLIIGYQLNSLETELTGVFVILFVGKKVMWQYEIGKSGGAVREMFPLAPRVPRVGPKRQKKPGEKPKKTKSGGE